MEGLDMGRDGHHQSSLTGIAEDYGTWGPAPDFGGGSVAPIPHFAVPFSGAFLQYQASPPGVTVSDSKA
ncbi:hypothetical protein CDL15_Pgr021363 [Punica granatum]|nr:hypothetical protein CDL15_Pgr021363 [Punica granatum]